MRKKTKTQEKIIEIYNSSESLFDLIKDRLPFDLECPNDQCGGRNGVRKIASAWKGKDGKYNIFCQVCGQEKELSAAELKSKQRKFEKEKKKHQEDEEEMYSVFEENE